MSKNIGEALRNCMEERDAARRELGKALVDHHRSRELLKDLRGVLITNKHKQLVDQELRRTA